MAWLCTNMAQATAIQGTEGSHGLSDACLSCTCFKMDRSMVCPLYALDSTSADVMPRTPGIAETIGSGGKTCAGPSHTLRQVHLLLTTPKRPKLGTDSLFGLVFPFKGHIQRPSAGGCVEASQAQASFGLNTGHCNSLDRQPDPNCCSYRVLDATNWCFWESEGMDPNP